MQYVTALSVRDGVWGARVGYVYCGAGVDIVERSWDSAEDTWYKIRWGDGYYWIHGGYVTIETPSACEAVW